MPAVSKPGYKYDAVDRLTQRMSTNNAPVTFGYDAVWNRIEAVDGTGRSTFTYDPLNRRTGAIDPAGHALTYRYDSAGRRTLTELANGTRTSYTYLDSATFCSRSEPSHSWLSNYATADLVSVER